MLRKTTLAWGLVAAVATLGLVPAEATDALLTCGGLAPQVTKCAQPEMVFPLGIVHGVEAPPCPPGAPAGQPCYVGVLRSEMRAVYFDNDTWTCRVVAMPGAPVQYDCTHTGPFLRGVSAKQHCFSFFSHPAGLPPQAEVQGGLGAWRCFLAQG